ncbi:MAG: 30S ribosomal protein S6 [Peptococcaceae bacterium]|nr:30S ribosomal protein S6 [Peptococcaceae bacterium]
MKAYELLYILKPELDEETTSNVIDKFSAVITNNKGEVVSVDKWGKRRLAYEIEDRREGFYTLVNFKAEPELPQELERVMKISDEVLRFLVTAKDE